MDLLSAAIAAHPSGKNATAGKRPVAGFITKLQEIRLKPEANPNQAKDLQFRGAGKR
ncbi:MAG TPA: hypothetical protein VG819_04135 [Rhizomicrobium sp.]|jgi:hypothetical protein|nr:hypothetical protein [Rhizomicrobium sp.]